MALSIKYFARVRDALGTSGETLAWNATWQTVDDLRQALCARGGAWAETLSREEIHCARNQQIAAWNDPIADGDEIAFFPPVTGG
ncbi:MULTISPECIES: molybdopterin converting factor subunit 1 [Hydrogenophilus]|jgi:molybdopterin synthase sulfur carrier subunit|uniref:Molybdopterin synthase sulfur carrier subunit n=1 Tax=Hydrogenophilus thermoluteolus TaxID=297 RepID=A0A2Z6DX07_HYDTE|nr:MULTISPECIES: molybdopterin converting factor subunit 1 [Hydrogenophilus]HCO77507.1 molybdopterin converting factor subunit 1 [Rhodocyclaceae bacterium]MBW7657366.1 molybdopterin converting factor subunit 1 [Hydrogenophilus thermoluteolus]BBD76859.1 molybdopterin synthase sulfur carrier subunit [Hydrogenophilus thermoluteolus]HNQ49790.1 molybdopterin converting factor subunit 1 [Hydrogenophilus thermoluteolus]HNU19760.1 molybdopterin converting factor subunit 1 [Hydrogenophilus thermoluteol